MRERRGRRDSPKVLGVERGQEGEAGFRSRDRHATRPAESRELTMTAALLRNDLFPLVLTIAARGRGEGGGSEGLGAFGGRRRWKERTQSGVVPGRVWQRGRGTSRGRLSTPCTLSLSLLRPRSRFPHCFPSSSDLVIIWRQQRRCRDHPGKTTGASARGSPVSGTGDQRPE